MRSSCKDCDRTQQRLAYKPRENPKVQRKQHIFDIVTREELRECSACRTWAVIVEYSMHGRFRSNICKPCARKNALERARRNPERGRQNARNYARTHAEQVRANLIKWRAANPERVAAHNRSAKKLANNRTYMREKSKSPEYRAMWNEWARRTGKGAEKAARRRAVLAGVTVEAVDRNAIIKRDRRICYLCGKFLKWREVTLDHVIPVARGGKHTANNLRVACGPCNFSKQARPLATLPLPI